MIVACASLFAACSSIPKTPARLYNLTNAELIHVKLFYFKRGYGRASATLPDGSALEGRYALARAGRPARDTSPGTGIDRAAFAEVYGYNRSTDSHPVGYGALSNDAGITLTMVFYSVDTLHGYGTGLARDNRGDWYRVHIGDLEGR